MSDSILIKFILFDGTSYKISVPTKVCLKNLLNLIKNKSKKEFSNISLKHQTLYENMNYYFKIFPDQIPLYPNEDERPLSEVFANENTNLGITLLLANDTPIVNKRESGTVSDALMKDMKIYMKRKGLKGDDPEELERFKEKMKKQSLEEMLTMNKTKKEDLSNVRKLIANDTEKRKETLQRKTNLKVLNDNL